MNNHAIGFSVSLLLHGGLLLFVLALAPPVPSVPKVVPLTLAMFEATPIAPLPKSVASPSSRPAPRRGVRKPPPEPVPDTKTEVANVAPTPPAPTQPSSSVAPAEAEPPTTDPTLASRAPVPDESAPPTASAASPPDPNAMARYAAVLTGLIARHRSYPRQAQLRGWQGQVELQLHIAPDGRLVAARVSRSSGFDVLDRQALDMARLARPLPVPPAPLRTEEFTVLVPVMFRLGG